MTQTHMAPRDICDAIGVGIEPVLAWIHSGQLKASNISNSPIRPRWRIAKTDLDAFLETRSNQQKTKSPVQRLRPKTTREYV